MPQLTPEQLDQLEQNIPDFWVGDLFGINLNDMIFFAREGLKVAGEEALLEQIDVLQDSWTRSLDALKSVCDEKKIEEYNWDIEQRLENIYWEDAVEAEEREILELMLSSSPITVEVVCAGSESIPETVQGQVTLAVKRQVPEQY